MMNSGMDSGRNESPAADFPLFCLLPWKVQLALNYHQQLECPTSFQFSSSSFTTSTSSSECSSPC